LVVGKAFASSLLTNDQRPTTNDREKMSVVRLKIDISGTTGMEAWQQIRQYDEAESASFGPALGGTQCKHPAGTPHPAGEWWAAEVKLATPLLAQYAISHYLEQPRVLDAEME
jgi:hypothetical protein